MQISQVIQAFKGKGFPKSIAKEWLSEIIFSRSFETEDEIIEIDKLSKADFKLLLAYGETLSDNNFLLEKAALYSFNGDKKNSKIYFNRWATATYKSELNADQFLARIHTLIVYHQIVPGSYFVSWAKDYVKHTVNNSFEFCLLSAYAIDEDSDKILDYYFKAYDLDDTALFLTYAIAEAHFDRNEWEPCIKYMLRFCELHDKNPNSYYDYILTDAYSSLHNSFYHLKNYPNSLLFFDKYINSESIGLISYHKSDLKNKNKIYANLYFRTKDFKKCIEYCDLILEEKGDKWIKSLKSRAKKLLAKHDISTEDLLIQEEEEAIDIELPEKNKLGIAAPNTERDLENHFYNRIVSDGMFHNHKVKLYQEGRQVHLKGYGRMDLILEEVGTGHLIIVELKNNLEDDEVINQIIRYKEGVEKHHIKKQNQKVLCYIGFHDARTEFIKKVKRDYGFINLVKFNLSYEVL
jgi:hypothetical protein